MKITQNELTIEELPQDVCPLPPVETPHFPTRAQAFLWRNWELVSVERLARVLACDESAVLDAARELGLRVPPVVAPQWCERGYVTLIRQNWHLLPYLQLLTLLDWTPHQLDFMLREDDFLWIKVGFCKPDTPPLHLEELSPPQRERTSQIRAQLENDFPRLHEIEAEQPFDFLDEYARENLPPRRETSGEKSESDAVKLDSRWTIHHLESDNMTAFVERFAAHFAARWGETLRASSDAENSEYSLNLRVLADAKRPRESHTISVSEKRIEITAVDEVGLLRGLQWLQNEAETRGAPSFSRGEYSRVARFQERIIYPFSAPYGDPFLEDETQTLPDELLLRLSEYGVNGVWLQGVLWSLVETPQVADLNAGWEARQENLRKLCARAARFGIGVYLYLNEPRALPVRLFKEHPALQSLRGIDISYANAATLCTSIPAVRELLRDSCERLFRAAPQLAGAFTITMLENPTNCHSRFTGDACPRCRERSMAEVVAEVNACIADGIRAASPNARVLAWSWGWSNDEMDGEHANFWSFDAIEKLPENIGLICTSEERLPTYVAGVPGSVIDYTISQVGPSPLSEAHWRKARERGLHCVAKVQFNNTWELSAVPYLPVPQLIEEHLHGLRDAGVEGLLLSWTLGGFPSSTLEIASRHYFEETRRDENGTPRETPQSFLDASTRVSYVGDWAQSKFGEAAPRVEKTLRAFSAAFREFPFAARGLYFAPYNYGAMNLLWTQPSNRASTMIGYPYDDLECWRDIYTREQYLHQFQKLEAAWQRGLDELESYDASRLTEAARHEYSRLENIARACLLHFRATAAQTEFIILRDQRLAESGEARRRELQSRMLELIDQEIETTRAAEDCVNRDSTIGFEASNHYYFTRQSLREKAIHCAYLRDTAASW